MKKLIALAVMFCAVMISATAAAATMANWVFVKDYTITVPYVPKYTVTPDQFFNDNYLALVGEGKSAREAKRIAGRRTQDYEANWEAEQNKLNTSNTYKLFSYYIDANSVAVDQTADESIAFHVVVKEVCTDAGRVILTNYLRENKKPVPAGLEKLSFTVKMIHFKSPDGITKYSAISNCVAFTLDGAQIAELALSNAPLNWRFIKPQDDLEAIFDAAYNRL